MSSTVQHGFTIAEPGDVLACFDATATVLFTSACHVTMGDREAAERLLTHVFERLQRTLGHGSRTVEVDELLGAAMTRYLADHADLSGGNVAAGAALDAAADDWARFKWGGAAEALAALSPPQRVALELRDVCSLPIERIADMLAKPAETVDQDVAMGRRVVAELAAGQPVTEVFQHTEIWLDDITRDTVRAAIRAQRPPSGPGATRRDGSRALLSRPQRWACIGAAVAAAIGAVVVHWIADAPTTDGKPIAFTLPPSTTRAPAPTGGAQAGASAANPGFVKANAGYSLTFGASSPVTQPVLLDVIVRYSNGAIGLSWHGHCDEPAYSVTVANVGDHVGLHLVTGKISGVVSCIGMPDRWSTVFDTGGLKLSPGPILPMNNAGIVDDSFPGYSAIAAPTGTDQQVIGTPTGFGSALVDARNQPWVFAQDCGGFQALPYLSPAGALFRVLTGEHTPTGLEPHDNDFDCTRFPPADHLTGPTGRFPQASGYVGQPVDCHGPYGSMTDIVDGVPTPSFTDQFYKGIWSTWDGCRVRSDVIHTKETPADCGTQTVDTITFADTLGDTMGPPARQLSYVRDPDNLVPGDRFPFATMETPPANAQDTGLRSGDGQAYQMWIVSGQTDAIYIVNPGGGVEVWSHFLNPPTC